MPTISDIEWVLKDRSRALRREAKEQWLDGKIRMLESGIELQELIIKSGRRGSDELIKMIVHIELDRVMLAELKEMRGTIQPNEVRN